MPELIDDAYSNAWRDRVDALRVKVWEERKPTNSAEVRAAEAAVNEQVRAWLNPQVTEVDFPTLARAELQLCGTAVEEGRMSLNLGALRLSGLYRSHGVQLSEAECAVMLARWVSARPATGPDHPNYIPQATPVGVSLLTASVKLLSALLDKAVDGGLTIEQLAAEREERIDLLHLTGYDMNGERVA